MTKHTNSVTCPICNGSGKIIEPHHSEIDETTAKSNMVKFFVKEGYSLRQIMRMMDYKSVRSVDYLLKRK